MTNFKQRQHQRHQKSSHVIVPIVVVLILSALTVSFVVYSSVVSKDQMKTLKSQSITGLAEQTELSPADDTAVPQVQNDALDKHESVETSQDVTAEQSPSNELQSPYQYIEDAERYLTMVKDRLAGGIGQLTAKSFDHQRDEQQFSRSTITSRDYRLLGVEATDQYSIHKHQINQRQRLPQKPKWVKPKKDPWLVKIRPDDVRTVPDPEKICLQLDQNDHLKSKFGQVRDYVCNQSYKVENICKSNLPKHECIANPVCYPVFYNNQYRSCSQTAKVVLLRLIQNYWQCVSSLGKWIAKDPFARNGFCECKSGKYMADLGCVR